MTPRRGVCWAGPGSRRIRRFEIELKDSRKSFKSSKLIENVVNHRFHQTEGVKHNGMATAKTDSFLELRVPKVYKHNQVRYFRVIRLLPLVDNPQLTQMRMVGVGPRAARPEQGRSRCTPSRGGSGSRLSIPSNRD